MNQNKEKKNNSSDLPYLVALAIVAIFIILGLVLTVQINETQKISGESTKTHSSVTVCSTTCGDQISSVTCSGEMPACDCTDCVCSCQY